MCACVRVYELIYTGGIGPRWKWDLNQIEKPKNVAVFKLYSTKSLRNPVILGMVHGVILHASTFTHKMMNTKNPCIIYCDAMYLHKLLLIQRVCGLSNINDDIVS